MTADKPRVALTLGDVAGIGPEIVVRAATDPQTLALCRPVIVGHPEIVRRTAAMLKQPINLQPIASPADTAAAGIPCWNPGRDDALEVPLGQIDPRAGRAAYNYLVSATNAALSGAVDAIVTAPLSKAALHAAGLNFPGHTEILAAECGIGEVAMMLYLPPGGLLKNPFGLGVAHATLHTSIRSVPDLLTVERVAGTIQLLDRFLKSIGCAQPRIGVCALNPHAGEEGLFGDEEARIIVPAVTQFSAWSPRPRRGGEGQGEGASAPSGSPPLQEDKSILLNQPLLERQPSVESPLSLTLSPAAGARGQSREPPAINAAGPIPADALLRRAAAGEFDGVVAMYHDQGHIALKLLGFDRAVNITLGLPIVRTSPSHGTAFDIAGKGIANADGFCEAIRMAVRLLPDDASAKRRHYP